jgi:hypothetical protein
MRSILTVSLLSTVLAVAPILEAHAFTTGAEDVEGAEDLSTLALKSLYFQDNSSQSPATATLAIESASPEVTLTPQISTLSEGFEDINTLAQKGWAFANNSSPPPATTTATANWLQGNSGSFGYFDQASPTSSNAYIATDIGSTAAITAPGQVSQWLLTPVLQFAAGGTFSFFTRTTNGNNRAELLEVLASTNGDSTSIGDFKNLLLTLGSATDPTVYPGAVAASNSWIQFRSGTTSTYGSGAFSATFANLPTSGTGRLAFRWSGTNAGLAPDPAQTPTNLNIGIDTVSTNLVVVPEPTTSALSGFALLGLRSLMRRRRRPEKAG